jgi:hypothetical protein
MEIVYYCGVLKYGDKSYLINPFEKMKNEAVAMPREDYVNLTKEAYDFVVETLDLEHREPECKIYIKSDIDMFQMITLDDIQKDELREESDGDVLEAYKTKALRMMNELIANQLMISNFELYHFFKLNNYLAAKGYFITDENREEKYLEIINSGDEEALSKLSEYLDSLDEFNSIDDAFQKYKEYKDRVKSAVTQEEINEAYYGLAGKMF